MMFLHSCETCISEISPSKVPDTCTLLQGIFKSSTGFKDIFYELNICLICHKDPFNFLILLWGISLSSANFWELKYFSFLSNTASQCKMLNVKFCITTKINYCLSYYALYKYMGSFTSTLWVLNACEYSFSRSWCLWVHIGHICCYYSKSTCIRLALGDSHIFLEISKYICSTKAMFIFMSLCKYSQ